MKSDNELMECTIDGNKQAYEELVIKYRTCALNFAKKYINDEYLAEDIIQESFAIVYVRRNNYKFDYSFKTYLYTIIRNKCIDYIRKKKNLCFHELEDLQYSKSTEEIIIDKENKSLLKKLFEQLNNNYQTALYLYEFEGMSYKDIGKVMGKNLCQVKIMIHRARKKLLSLAEEVKYDER